MHVPNETCEEEPQSTSRSAGNRWILFPLLIFVAGLLNWYAGRHEWPFLRFTTHWLRTIAGLVILVTPWIAFFSAVALKPFAHKWKRAFLLGILIPIMLVTLPLALLDLTVWTPDPPLRSVEMGGYRVRLYQLECGVLCDFVVGVDQERVLLPYLVISQRLYIFDDDIDATVEVVGKNQLRVTTLPYTEKDPNIRVQIFQIKPYFLF